MSRLVSATAALALLAAIGCGDDNATTETCDPWTGEPPRLGAQFSADGCQVSFRVYSAAATRVELWIYPQPTGAAALTRELTADASGVLAAVVSRAELDAAGVGSAIYYGYRAWGPNWPHEADWTPGSSVGIRQDVDSDGNRFNPNKLVVDPYAREMSHDPGRDMQNFATGPDHRHVDTGELGPKGIVVATSGASAWQRPVRDRADDVIYEVHVRGLTMNDLSVDAALRGTYAGAGKKAAYLAELGVTAIELLPVHETNNQYNGEVDEGNAGANYWGYASLSFFAPERRYAADQSPGGPTREFQAMVRAFHDEGVKVYIDVVYNHTAETGVWDRDGRVTPVLSWRGLDNATYYQLGSVGREFRNDNGVGPNIAVANPRVADMVIDSLRYWHEDMGVDGYRFDLASVLGNTCDEVCFEFDATAPGLLARIGEELGTADLIAEPWSITSYQLGEFLAPWAEWNDSFRDAVRRHINKDLVEPMTPRQLIGPLLGSADRFEDDGRAPWHSVNFVVSHDGFTLRDLFACNNKNNDQPWPYGPSPGGSDNNLSWDQGGAPAVQRQATRTAMALLAISSGVPMFTGGDEFLRSQGCNNNMFNLDNDANWLDWQAAATGDGAAFTTFVRDVLALRAGNAALRPASYGAAVSIVNDTGAPADDAYLDNDAMRYVGLTFEGSVYVGYNGATIDVNATLPAPPAGSEWRLVLDTAAAREPNNSGLDEAIAGGTTVRARSLVIAIAR